MICKRKITHRERVRRVFVESDSVVSRSWWVGNGSDVDLNCAGRKSTVAIADGVGNDVGTVEPWVGCVVDRAVRIDHDGSVRSGCHRNGQHIVIRIAVVGQDVDVRQRSIFLRAATVCVGDWWVLNVDHRHSHRRSTCPTTGVSKGVSERVHTEEVRIGRVVDRAIRQHGDRAIGRWRCRLDIKRTGGRQIIVSHHVDVDQRLFVGRDHIVHGVEWPRHWFRDVDKCGRCSNSAIPVTHFVFE